MGPNLYKNIKRLSLRLRGVSFGGLDGDGARLVGWIQEQSFLKNLWLKTQTLFYEKHLWKFEFQ